MFLKILDFHPFYHFIEVVKFCSVFKNLTFRILLGCGGIFRISLESTTIVFDCLSIAIWYFHQKDIAAIFEAADKDNSGTLTVTEFQDVIDDILIRYPQVEIYLRSKHLRDVKDLLKDSQGHEDEVDIEGFKSALSHADTQMKNLPATAQVIAHLH